MEATELVGNNAEVYSDVSDTNMPTDTWQTGLPYRDFGAFFPGAP